MSSPADTFGEFAEHYDAYTDHPLYEQWILGIEQLAREHGLAGRRVLDAGCGTGKSFLPLLELGYSVTGFDPVPAMLDRAAAKAAGRAQLVVADLRDLPVLGSFDLVLCLNDICNYLADPDDLRAAVSGLAANLAPGGLVVMDANTLAAFRTVFASTHRREAGGSVFIWEGGADESFAEGDVASVALEIFAPGDDGRYSRLVSPHVQRHHPRPLVESAFEEAGLDLVAALGQHNDGRRDPFADESSHFKTLYVARRAHATHAEEVSTT